MTAGPDTTFALNAPSDGRVVAADGTPQLRTRLVLIYLLLGLAALLPGLWLRFGPDLGIGFVESLRATLEDIRFGSGIRFWLGVTGASLMAVLLLYPLRKIIPGARLIGSVGAWFHFHMVVGIGAPVLILYHTNFGLGGSNANVALWSMLLVVASGIVGHFVYARASAGFYAGRQQAQDLHASLVALLDGLAAFPEERAVIVAELDVFDAEFLTPRRGIVPSLAARFRIEKRRRVISRLIGIYLAESAKALALDRGQQAALVATAGQHLKHYFRLARHAASRSVREQIWARWRLLHLPLFLIMLVATVLHVAAVWNMDGPRGAGSDLDSRALSDLIDGDLTPPAPKPAVRKRPQAQKIEPLELPQAPPRAAARPAPQPKSSGDLAAASAGAPPTGLIPPAPVPASRPVRKVEKSIETADAAGVPIPLPPKPVARAERPATAPAPTPAPGLSSASPPATDADMKAIYNELPRRSGEPMMSLGGAKPRTLTEQITAYKARKAAGQFAHSLAETGFALTGKHIKVECASCHKAPLKEVRSSEPRQCIACHKKDDVHRGRRPNCVQCHTTNRWSEIK